MINKYKLNYEIIDDQSIDYYIKYCKQAYNITRLETLYDDQILKHNGLHDAKTAGYKWINNGTVNTLVPGELLNSYLGNGWESGRLASESIEKMKVDTAKQIEHIDRLKPKKLYSSEFRKGKKQLYKDNIRIFVLPEEVEKYLSVG